MDTFLYILFLLLLNSGWAPPVEGQCFVRKPDDIPDKEFPDLLKEYAPGYSATVRINYYYQKRSALVTEYYRAEDASGRVDLERNGSRISFVYFNGTDEAFTVRDFDCESTRLDRFQFSQEEDPLDSWVYRHQLHTVLGPTAALLKASVDYQRGLLTYMGNSSRSIRDIPAHFWQQCVQDDRIIVQYYFAVDNWKNEFGIRAPVHLPLRIVVQGENLSKSFPRIFRTYDFFFFQPLLGQEDLGIPEGKGCVRLASDLPECRTFGNQDLSYSAEILYTPSADLHSYVTYSRFIYDGRSELVAFSYTNWTRPFRDKKRRVDAYRNVVYSVEDGLTYRVDPDSKQCSVSMEEEMEAAVDLPDGIQLPLGNQLFLADADKYKFLGKKRRGDVLVDVFEYRQDMDPDSVIISTRYFLPNDEDEEEIPVGLSLTVLNTAQKTSVRLTVNFFDFSTVIDDKVSAFDVDACFPHSRDRRWISFVLAVHRDEELLKNTEPYVPAIRRKVAEMLMDVSSLSWPRISNVLVDSDASALYAFVSVLERPDYLLDFSYQPDGVLDDLDDSVGMTTKRGCAKLCLEYLRMCYAFSYCGRVCYLKTRSSRNQGSGTSGCQFYLRKTGYDPLPTIDSALETLGQAFDEKELKISFTVKNAAGKYREVELPITAFDAEARDPDARYSKIVDFDRHYSEYQYGRKLKKGAGYVTNRGGVPFLTCQSVCLADPDCQSLSSCAGLAECLLSSKHAKEIPDTELVKKNDCIVLTRNYLDAFVRHDGLIKTTTAAKRLRLDDQELCARACLLDVDLDCHSFDFCPRSNYTCLLHSVRFLHPDNEKLTFDPTGLCGHYSRNYVRDFQKLKSKILTQPSRVALKGVTVEECARLCAEEAGFDCRSFQFCRQKADCMLSGETDVPPSTVYGANCDVYYLTEKLQHRKKSRSVGERTYSSGLVAGLGVFFCILGLGFGIVTLLLFGKVTGRKI